jgi:hypothetical protein
MQLPPVDFTDVNMLLAVGAIVLLITSELASSQYGLTNLTVNKKKLKNAALATGALFLATIAVKIVGIIVGT